VNISALFLTGFLSGAFFAPFLGSLIDLYGRKNSAIVYCVLEVIINVMEHSHNFTILLMGRVLGGISTNLLFSSFESWMVTAHNSRGFPRQWMKETYSQMSMVNGGSAIFAGIIAQVLEDSFGHIGPFQGAIALTVLALMIISFTWEENYGEANPTEEGSDEDNAFSDVKRQFIEGWSLTLNNTRVLRLGVVQALSEGAMYTFVFMWVPTLLSLAPGSVVPTGVVFSSLMISITIGGMIFPLLERLLGGSVESTAAITYLIAALSMMVPAICLSSSDGHSACFEPVLASFIVVELGVGLFLPAAGTLRSKYIPEKMSGTVMNIFRLPLNGCVVLGTYLSENLEGGGVFWVVCGWFGVAFLTQLSMCKGTLDADQDQSKDQDKVKKKKTKAKKA